MILLGFRYLASSIPLISLVGVAIGVGSVLALSASSIPRNPTISNSLVRRSPTGSSLAEASGSIGIVHSLSILYAFMYLYWIGIDDIRNPDAEAATMNSYSNHILDHYIIQV